MPIIPAGTEVFLLGDPNVTATVLASFIGPEQSAERGHEYQPNGRLDVFYYLLLPPHLRFYNPAQTMFVSAIVAHSDGVQRVVEVPTCILFAGDDPDDCSTHEHER